ncbi:MAG: hypothetical protein DRR11_04720 [Gammaproteobacteria bacterium]|nr:MAG: hypothetical protein DRR11_04720 [Gammaproteobacteria bacterium]RLA37460.1 MAG: hypothetical protein DRR15_01830 [Gammaproteobacteria bacterium]
MPDRIPQRHAATGSESIDPHLVARFALQPLENRVFHQAGRLIQYNPRESGVRLTFPSETKFEPSSQFDGVV